MNKECLVKLKNDLLAYGMITIMASASAYACNNKKIPDAVAIGSEYSNIENYYKYVIQNGEAVKLYDSRYVYLFFNKETYEVNEYIYNNVSILGGLGTHVELYDIPSDEMVAFSSGIATSINAKYYNYLLKNNYLVCLADAGDYIEGYHANDFYSIDDIRNLEPYITEGLKFINSVKNK